MERITRHDIDVALADVNRARKAKGLCPLAVEDRYQSPRRYIIVGQHHNTRGQASTGQEIYRALQALSDLYWSERYDTTENPDHVCGVTS